MSERAPAANISAILLAGGASRRFVVGNKLLAEIGGEPLLRRSGRILLESGVGEVVVVTGAERERYADILVGLRVRFEHNPDWAQGMGGSIAVGARALLEVPAREAMHGVLIVPGDLPCLTQAVIHQLTEAFALHGGQRIIVPLTRHGEQVNPVLWPDRFLPLLCSLPRARGAKHLLAELARERADITIWDDTALLDMDTMGDYERLMHGASA